MGAGQLGRLCNTRSFPEEILECGEGRPRIGDVYGIGIQGRRETQEDKHSIVQDLEVQVCLPLSHRACSQGGNSHRLARCHTAKINQYEMEMG